MCAEDHVRAFGQRLRQLRRQAKLTQAKLAERSDISCVYVNKLERGLAAPSMHVLHRLAQSLGTDVADLLSPDGEGAAPANGGARISPYLSLYLSRGSGRTRQLVFNSTDDSIPVPTCPEDKLK